MVRISLCMIVRDEESMLARCLESVAGVVDEICVLDTGSQDGTVELAGRFGARVAEFEWCDDFAAARNASLAMATGDWVLVLDADEALEAAADGRAKLERFAKSHADQAGHVLIDNALEAGDSSYTQVTRFFPRGSQWAFAGRIHEQVLEGGKTPKRGSTGLVVKHYGYSKEALEQRDKLARNEALLRSVLEQEPSDSYTAYQLGRTLAVGGRHAEALGIFEQAVEHCADEAPFVAHLFEMAASSLRELGHSQQALDWLSNIEEAFRDRADTCFLIALLAMDTGDLERARSGFEHCLTLAGQVPKGGVSWPAASTWAAAANLGVLLEVLEQPDEARRYYQQALGFQAGNQASLAGLARLGA